MVGIINTPYGPDWVFSDGMYTFLEGLALLCAANPDPELAKFSAGIPERADALMEQWLAFSAAQFV